MNTEYNVRTLNGLIATTIDSIDGYEESAEETKNDRFATMFRARAQERHAVCNQLKGDVRRLGAEPEDDGTLLAGVHRVFLNLRNAVTGSDDEAVIAEVERGEDHIKEKFEDAIADNALDAQCRETVQKCYDSIRQGHDQVSAIKHSMEAAG